MNIRILAVFASNHSFLFIKNTRYKDPIFVPCIELSPYGIQFFVQPKELYKNEMYYNASKQEIKTSDHCIKQFGRSYLSLLNQLPSKYVTLKKLQII